MSETRFELHWPTVRQLFTTELRIFLRDRRTVTMALVIPLLTMPIFLFAGSWNERQREQRIEQQTFRYAVTGSEAELARRLIRAGGPAADPVAGDAEVAGADDGKTAVRGHRGAEDVLRVVLEEAPATQPRQALEKRDLHFVIETFSAAEVKAQGIKIAPLPEEKVKARPGEARPPKPPAELPLLRVVFAADWDYSETAAGAMLGRLETGIERSREKALAGAGYSLTREQILPIAAEQDLATAGQRTGLQLGRFALLYLLISLLMGGSVIAADTIAGEKERGSLETLLTSAASRSDIVTAKMLLILAVGATMAICQVLTFALYAGLKFIPLPESFAVELSALSVLWLVLLLAPLAGTVAGVLLLVSAYSKTYKDFQQRFFPAFVLTLLPGLAAVLPGVELRSAIVVVPIANLSVAMREILVGKIDWLMLPLAFLVSAGAAYFLMRRAMDALSAERLVTAAGDEADFRGGPALFPRRVLPIFAVMWVLLFLSNGGIPWLAESIERQLAFNFGVIFLGGSFFAIRRYRLPWREAFALRPVKPITWLAVLIGAPSFLVAGVAVAKLSEFFLPVPKEMLEAFGKALVPGDFSIVKTLILIAVLPGIVEELTFRGVLLYGLRKRFHPVVVALVVGLVFGLFHIALFRLVSTAFLGAGLTTVTMLTGSVFPAMLWHAINNSLALLAGVAGLNLMDLDPWVYGAATVLSALSFWILWRNRTPLPGLRQPPPDQSEPSSSR